MADDDVIGARIGGAQIFENCKVLDMKLTGGKVAGVISERGDIDSQYLVNCADVWARELGRKASVNIPLHAAARHAL